MGECITSRTLVGIGATSFPYSHGNCFSMLCDNGKKYRIVNFCYENLTEAIKRGVSLPVRVLPIYRVRKRTVDKIIYSPCYDQNGAIDYIEVYMKTQVKIFKDSSHSRIQNEINTWLMESPGINVVDIRYSISECYSPGGSHTATVSVLILYTVTA